MGAEPWVLHSLMNPHGKQLLLPLSPGVTNDLEGAVKCPVVEGNPRPGLEGPLRGQERRWVMKTQQCDVCYNANFAPPGERWVGAHLPQEVTQSLRFLIL